MEGEPARRIGRDETRASHYGRRALYRVLGALPSVETRALGKEAVCRVPHSAKPALGKGRLCLVPNTRQRGTLGKRSLCRVSGTRQRITIGKKNLRRRRWPSVILCRVLAVSTRQMFCLCRVLQACSDTRQSIFILFFIFVFQFFLWHLYSTLKHMFLFGTFL